MHTLTALLIFFIGLSAVGLMASVLLTLRLRKLHRLLELESDAQECDDVAEASSGFTPVLRQVELQARLQQGLQRREMPEKYRFIRSLAARGVPAAEIAGILNLAPGEVEQLIALAQVTQRHPQVPVKTPRAKRGRALIRPKDFSAIAEKAVSPG